MINRVEQNYISNYNKKSIIVIGAGPCGILSVKYLKGNLNVICIENKQDIGGQWLFDNYSEFNHPNLQLNSYYKQNGALPSSLYENLQANVPKILMTYKGFPSKLEYDEFMQSTEFQEYLQEYCQYFELKKRMIFNNYVSSVRLTKNLTSEEKEQVGFHITKRFLVKVTSAENYNKNIRYLQADSVIVSTGHCSVPNYPNIKNTELFKGKSIHMHSFRKSTIEEFKDKHLVVYGVSNSAQDIVFIALKKQPPHMQPKMITVIGNERSINILKSSKAYAQEIQQKKLQFISPYIKEFVSDRSLILQSGEKVENIDFVLYATGYKFYYPFLDNKVDKLIDTYNERSNSIGPLYKRLFCVREPNLIFMGLMFNTISIQQCYERQAVCVARYLNDEIQLPTSEQMLEEFKKDYSNSLTNHSDGRDYLKISFFVGLNELEYVKQLAELSKMPIDEEFNKYLKEDVLPLYTNLVFKGEYALLKKSKIAHKFPSYYSPRAGYL